MDATFSGLDWLLVASYFFFLIWLSWKKGWSSDNEEEFLLSGRKVTLPAFVATLVSTWYGGILGVGEWSYQYGISQWLILGAPFYIFSAIFAIFLAGKIRLNKALTIPEAIANRYSERAGRLSALPIFILVSPAPYILMLGLLFQFLSGGDAPFLFYASLVALFSVLYITIGGFGAVIRTDILQIILMFSGFIILLMFAVGTFGGFGELSDAVTDVHFDISGGNSIQYILVWFFIALWTFVDPSFHQRAAAAESPSTARKGIFVSILFWMGFDFLTAFAGLYAFAILGPGLEQPVLAYPLLADQILPIGLKGLFFVSLLATIMSTLDSYLFISGQTLGRDFLVKYFPQTNPNLLTRIGILVSALLGILLIIVYPSVIDLWYVIGSVFIPGLLVPVLGIYLRPFRLKNAYAIGTIIGASAVSFIWLILGTWQPHQAEGYAFFGVEPFYPGLATAIIIWLIGRDGAEDEHLSG
ncbi:sodium:solute symporter family protein [Rhodohalobacter halophilus]|uniref:sodium:solute symporter family protein n=1 Tax=Rhodohalobacter halophilus TaxID=1812810 RepID=UPI00083F747C|nr:sodium:solute symporter family protein [Rhodohalobacter halophilus]